jgi:hypothetical protein
VKRRSSAPKKREEKGMQIKRERETEWEEKIDRTTIVAACCAMYCTLPPKVKFEDLLYS